MEKENCKAVGLDTDGTFQRMLTTGEIVKAIF